MDGAGQVPFQQDALPGPVHRGIGNGRGGDERLGIGMQGMLIQLIAAGQLHNLPQIHHSHIVGDVPDHRQIMADEDISQAQLLLNLHHQPHNLGLDGHIQGGHDLVADDERGIHGQGAGNGDALALAAGELMGIAVGEGGVQPHQLQHLGGALQLFRLASGDLVDLRPLHDDLMDGHPGIQGGIRILGDHLQLPVELAQVLLSHMGDIPAVVGDLSGGGNIIAHHAVSDGGLSGAGLPYDA